MAVDGVRDGQRHYREFVIVSSTRLWRGANYRQTRHFRVSLLEITVSGLMVNRLSRTKNLIGLILFCDTL
jgi:hypothetical protein